VTNGPFDGTIGNVALYYKANAKPGNTTITVSAKQRTHVQGTAAEYAGVNTSRPLAATALSAGVGNVATSGLTPSTPAGDVVYGAIEAGQPPVSLTAGPGFSLRTAASDFTAGSEDKVSTTAGPQQASMLLGSSTTWYMVAAALRPDPQSGTTTIATATTTTMRRHHYHVA
jgi:hypothetical protein